MHIISAGHRYELENFENKDTKGQEIQFIEKAPSGCGGELCTVNDGTTNEEMLRVLIDRIAYLDAKFPCKENSIVLEKLEEALRTLNLRTASRLSRGVEGKALA